VDDTETVLLDQLGLDALIGILRADGYQVIGPRVADDAIVLAELSDAADLPVGWGVAAEAGTYRLRRRDDTAAFGHSAGPQSWKKYVHPPKLRLWSATRDGDGGFTVDPDPPADPRPYALFGVRPCDLASIAILDRVLGEDPAYRERRDRMLVVAVNCTEPGPACFCVSAGGGPEAEPGYDLVLTEQTEGAGDAWYVAAAGSAAGAALLDRLPARTASAAEVARARTEVADAAGRMGRALPAVDLPDLLAANRTSPHWDEVASRCLNCTNCTLVCPTCFCTTTEDVTDLAVGHAERWQRWESCFDPDFSYVHGGAVRQSGAARYRHWISHKLGTWTEQFGSSGCVGCGRCIVWCPVGIDLTAEVRALAAADRTAADGGLPGTGADHADS
jgi:ferredoxin